MKNLSQSNLLKAGCDQKIFRHFSEAENIEIF